MNIYKRHNNLSDDFDKKFEINKQTNKQKTKMIE